MPRPADSAEPPPRTEQPDDGRERIALALERDAALPPGLSVDDATSAVMSLLASRLTPGQAHELLDALPPYVRTRFGVAIATLGYEAAAKLDRAELVAHVADLLGVTPGRAEAITAAVLAAVCAELPAEIARRVALQLPRDLNALWLASSPIAPPSVPPASYGDAAREAVEEDIQRRVQLPDNVTADAAIRAVVEIFSQRLSGGEAFDLLLGLPDDLRRLAEGGVLGRDEQASVFDRETLMGAVAYRLRIAREEAAPVVIAVLAAVKSVLPVKEIDDVAEQLPGDLRSLWAAAT
ncbi:MAG: hypothetical protein JWP87_335 [Labilithrix sp.]|nr:hypothetical protein [Labilithrix sp.]